MKLYMLHEFGNGNGNLPVVDHNFVLNCLKTCGITNKKGGAQVKKSLELKEKLGNFYDSEFKDLVGDDKVDISNLSQVLGYLAVILTN